MGHSFTRILRRFASVLALERSTALLFFLLHLANLALIPPAAAEEPCTHLGIETVNWKSPDSDRTGVLVVHAMPGCIAAEMGVRAGDVLIAINGKPVANQYDLEALAGNPASLGFSLTLQDASGQSRSLKRPAADLPGETFSQSGWAGVFLALSLTVTPLVGWMLWQHPNQIVLVGAAVGAYETFKAGGRKYGGVGINGALSVGMLLALVLVGPLGLAYSLAVDEAPGPTGQGSEPLYHAQGDRGEISFRRDQDFTPGNLGMLASLAGHYPSEILDAHPQIEEALRATLGKSYQPLMEMLLVETPAQATPGGGLAYALCKAHACGDGRLVVYISPSLNVSALLFHDDKEIGLPETPAQGETDPDNWSRLVLYEQAAFPQTMAWPLYQAAMTNLDQVEGFSVDGNRGQISSRFWIVGKLQ